MNLHVLFKNEQRSAVESKMKESTVSVLVLLKSVASLYSCKNEDDELCNKAIKGSLFSSTTSVSQKYFPLIWLGMKHVFCQLCMNDILNIILLCAT